MVLENGYVQTFPSTFPTLKTTLLYSNTLSLVGFSVIPKCVTLNDPRSRNLSVGSKENLQICCHHLRLKCTKFDFCWGSATDPAGGAYSAPPDSLAVAVLGWGQGGTSPPNLAQAPQIFDWFQLGYIGVRGRTRVYAVYQPLVFLTAYNNLIFHNKT